MKLRKLVLPAAMIFAWVGDGSAATLLNLAGPFDNTIGPQSDRLPASSQGRSARSLPISATTTSHKPGTEPPTTCESTTPTPAPNNQFDGPEGTNPYTVAQITDVVGTSFSVAIDVNTADGGETLSLFEVWNRTTDTVLYSYNGPTILGPSLTMVMVGGLDIRHYRLVGLSTDTRIQFHAVWSNASDGAESFFLVPTHQRFPSPRPTR